MAGYFVPIAKVGKHTHPRTQTNRVENNQHETNSQHMSQTQTATDHETMLEPDEEREAIQNLVHDQLRLRPLRNPACPVFPVVRRDPGKTAPFALEGEQVALIDFYPDDEWGVEWGVFLIEADEHGNWEHPRCEPDAAFENRKAAVEHAAESLKEADN